MGGHSLRRAGAAFFLVVAVVATALGATVGTAPTAGAATTTLVPVADALVNQSTPTTRSGASGQLVADASPVIQSFLRFDLRSLASLQSAKLRLHVADISNGGSPSGGRVASSTNTTWSEATVTWNTRPSINGATLTTLGTVTRNTWVEVDVTAAVRAGSLATIALSSTNADGAYYDSRETGANAPQLVVTSGTTTTTSSSTTTTSTTVPPVSGPVVAAVGDAVCAPSGAVTSTACRQVAVSNLLVNDPDVSEFLALGDLQYENGELASFQTAYEASYGRVKAKTRPAPGNHEYNTAGATGYYTYFGAAAGDPTKGYYSFDFGTTWHVVALNSNCGAVACASGSTQEQWLRADLAASTRPCTIAYWHHPRFSSGSHGSDATYAAFWTALAQDGAELVLNGHEHDYERFAPQSPTGAADPNGIREMVVGTGGRSLSTFGTPVANSVVRLSTFGVLKLTLGTNAYSWSFVRENGTVADSGTGTCH